LALEELTSQMTSRMGGGESKVSEKQDS
jgi:hypothetical protein